MGLGSMVRRRLAERNRERERADTSAHERIRGLLDANVEIILRLLHDVEEQGQHTRADLVMVVQDRERGSPPHIHAMPRVSVLEKLRDGHRVLEAEALEAPPPAPAFHVLIGNDAALEVYALTENRIQANA